MLERTRGAEVLTSALLTRGGEALLVSGVDAGSPAVDKFVICQVPAYTEGEDALRKALNLLTALQYDKRNIICVICDGIICKE